MLNSYNKIAPAYSLLARLMYGSILTSAKHKLILTLPEVGNLLVLGGGNGEVLQAIYDHAPLISVIYVEASSTMISLAKSNAPPEMNISYEHTDSFQYAQEHIDAIYAAFFFDLFTPNKIEEIIRTLEERHTNKPTWHIADFNLDGVIKWRIVRIIQIKASILFFRYSTGHSTKKLPPVFDTFKNNGFNSLNNSSLNSHFLWAEVYKRP